MRSSTAILTLLATAMGLGLWSLWALATTGVPVVTSADAVVEAALDALQVGPGKRFVDLGCGFGAVVRAARRRKAIVVGYELNLAVWAITWFRHLFDMGVHIRLADSRRANLSKADAVYAYLMPHAMGQLAGPLERGLKPGTRVASASFPIPGWEPVQTVEVGLRREPVYVYVIGRHKA